ncbi:hypothetical protein TWF730_003765 [Orbilia blumenaviensis]|uniref:Zn(2)-C6 fungal-type domain-containing protein n=1 Tax=Orbilia blumenaviensis TaxID=1796055 RepID=A0AAV9U6L2_9PEZI
MVDQMSSISSGLESSSLDGFGWIGEVPRSFAHAQTYGNSNSPVIVPSQSPVSIDPSYSYYIPSPENPYVSAGPMPPAITKQPLSSAMPTVPPNMSHPRARQPQLKPPCSDETRICKPRGKRRKHNGSARSQDMLLVNIIPRKAANRDSKGEGCFRVGGKIRSSFNSEDREKTALTRGLGACEPCRRLKVRCNRQNSYSPCERCSSVKHNLSRPPCVHITIIGLKVHRDGSTLTDKLKNWVERQLASVEQSRAISDGHDFLPYEQPRKISVTQDLELELEITVALFDQEAGDKTSYYWVDSKGKKKEIDMPHYFIYDMEEAKRNMERYARQARPLYIKEYLKNTNPIIQKTFEIACQHAKNARSTLIIDALSLWTATRLTEKPWRICGDDLLGVDPYTEEGHPFHGIVPVTPIMDTQIDEITIKTLLYPLREKVLQALHHKLEERRREDWLEIFLAVFILLCDIEWILSDVIKFTKRHHIQPREHAQDKPSLVEAYVHTCKTLLSHFHSYKGAMPFQVDWNKSTDFSGLPSSHIDYIRSLQSRIAVQEAELKTLKNASMYETPMFWCYQAIVEGWRGDVNVGKIPYYTEEDFLTS